MSNLNWENAKTVKILESQPTEGQLLNEFETFMCSQETFEKNKGRPLWSIISVLEGYKNQISKDYLSETDLNSIFTGVNNLLKSIRERGIEISEDSNILKNKDKLKAKSFLGLKIDDEVLIHNNKILELIFREIFRIKKLSRTKIDDLNIPNLGECAVEQDRIRLRDKLSYIRKRIKKYDIPQKSVTFTEYQANAVKSIGEELSKLETTNPENLDLKFVRQEYDVFVKSLS